MKTFYNKEEVLTRLILREGWRFNDNAIERSFEFRDFTRAFAFLTCVALLSEKMGHHPTLINCYNKVDIRLCTHSAGGVTDRDFQLAEEIDRFAPKI